jgi:trehalose transport system permease protein
MVKKLLQPFPLYLSLAVVSLIILYPIFLMVRISASYPADIMKPHKDVFWGPGGITLEHWRNIFTSGLLLPSLFKSLLVATMVMLLAILIAAPAAYVIARLGSPFQYLCIIALFLSRTFPEVAIALPVSVVFLHWDLLDTSFGLILGGCPRINTSSSLRNVCRSWVPMAAVFDLIWAP